MVVTMISVITLRQHQSDACDAVEDAWRAGTKRPLVDACVSAGKSLMFAELARREIDRGGRVIIVSHTRELVQQNAKACRDLMPGVYVGMNAEALGERTWNAPVISASIQSIFRSAKSFGSVTCLLGDEAQLWPHSEAGMYRELVRGLGDVRIAGASGTVFRLQGGSLVEGEGAPFDRVVYRYSILDGIHDGYLCPAFSIGADDKIDRAKLKTRLGEFTSESSDAQMIKQIDNHIYQMVANGENRRAWLIFEASTKSATAMANRMREWKIPTGLVLGKTPAKERAATVEAFRAGQLRAMVNINALCLDDTTEILTSDGFVGIDDMRMDHRVAGWKPDGSVDFAPPSQIVRRNLLPHEHMIRIGGEHTPQIRVTNNHRMVVRCGADLKSTKVVPASDLLIPMWKCIPAAGECEPERLFAQTPIAKNSRAAQIRANSYNYRKNGVPSDEARGLAETHADRVRGMRYKHPHELTLDECELVGFWLGDGSKSGGIVTLAQSFRYPDTIARVNELLRLTGVHFCSRICPPDRNTNSHESITWQLARGTGGRGQEVERGYFELEPYLEKDGTPLFWGLNKSQLKALLHGFWLADGNHHSKVNGTRIVGTQKPLYDLLQAICSVRGISATIRLTPLRACQKKLQYVFAWQDRIGWRTHGRNAVAEPRSTEPERVWCVTSSTSFIICRRQGKVFVTGNCVGFDVPHVDLLVFRRPTASLGLYIQQAGRGLRTIGGNITASVAAGKADCAVLDFAGNIDVHGPLDFIRPKENPVRLVSCEECKTRNVASALRCWSCDSPMMKNCPACLESMAKGTLDCPSCGYDLRKAPSGEPKAAKLREVPSGAALIRSWGKASERNGGWLPISAAWEASGETLVKAGGTGYVTVQILPDSLTPHAAVARWLRVGTDGVDAILIPNGLSRTSARQISRDGSEIMVPLPSAVQIVVDN